MRLTTCKRLTNSLPKLSLITLPPPETAGYQVGRVYGRTCQYPSDFISWGYRGEYFSSSTWGKSEGRYYCGWWDSNPRPTPKAHGLSTTPFVKKFSGVIVRLTTRKRLTNSLPKLSLITLSPLSWCLHSISLLQYVNFDYIPAVTLVLCQCIRAAT